MKSRTYLIFISFLIILGCKNASKQYLVFDYEDFGPQSMAWETFRMQWWQWNDHGDSSDPNYRYDIKIIVYRDISLKEIKSLFPVNKTKKKDYRYIDHKKAVTYLERNIRELDETNEEWADLLKKRLMTTRNGIERELIKISQ